MLSVHFAKNLVAGKEMVRRFRWILRVRPQSLAMPLLKLLPSYTRRLIVPHGDMLIYLDPLSNLGVSILQSEHYEAPVVEIFRQELKAGDVYLDIGANEGFFAALAVKLVGPQGTIIAVEPQSRLLDVLEINLALNGAAGAKSRHILHGAVGPSAGDSVSISLTPLSNTGASSIVNAYRWSKATETVRVISGEQIVEAAKVGAIDFAKIDVEGYEPEVVQALLPLMKSGRIRKILLDYHLSILRKRGIDPQETHAAILACGYTARMEAPDLSGYCLYTLD